MDTNLPSATSHLAPTEAAAVTDFVMAVNGGKHLFLSSLFAADAQVNDQLRNFWGSDAISDWLKQEIVDEHVKLTVRSVRKHYDVVILDAEMSGDFAATGLPQPLTVDMYITVHDAKIVRLLILLVRNEVAEPEIRR
jgi:hypothetical protein